MTGGKYFRAQDADQLDERLPRLPREVVRSTARTEMTVWFVLVARCWPRRAIGLSLWWNRYP